MRRFAAFTAAAAVLVAAALIPTEASAGCYRMGETGYHWYGFCAGPGFLYPHHRVCRHHHCWYR